MFGTKKMPETAWSDLKDLIETVAMVFPDQKLPTSLLSTMNVV